MKTSVSEVGKNKVRLHVEVPGDRIAELLDRTYKELAKDVRVPGFRPGRVPKQVIDQRLGKDFVRSETLKSALPDFFAEAVREEGLEVVAPPDIDVTSFEDGTGLTFDATVETMPTPEVGEYAGLKVSAPAAEPTDADVEAELERLRVKFASLEVVERPLASGDFALIDLSTYRHDEIVDEATAKDLLVEVGSEMIVPELDAELQGKRRGDILKVTAALPEHFGDKAGWQVGMQVLVKEVKARRLPALDDDFATEVSEFDTLDELRADIREKIASVKAGIRERTVKERILDAFVEQAVKLDAPEGMIEMELDGLLETFVRALASRGIPVEAWMEHEKLDVPALRSRFREQAERNIALRLGLNAVAEREGIVATGEERQKEVERIANAADKPAEEVEEILSRHNWESVDGDIIRSKVLDLLVQRAEITTEDEPT